MSIPKWRQQSEFRGSFKCPKCSRPSMILDSRPSGNGQRRRRVCAKGHRFTSFESVGLASAKRSQLRAILDKAIKEIMEMQGEEQS